MPTTAQTEKLSPPFYDEEAEETSPCDPKNSKRLTLEPLTVAHAKDMVGVLADPKLYEFTGGEPPNHETLSRRYQAQIGGSSDRSEIWLNWIIRRNADKQAVGFVQATVIEHNANVAWLIGTGFQGSGFASESAQLMCDWLGANGIHSICANIHPDHVASNKVASSIGLCPTDQIDADGEVTWIRDGTNLRSLFS